MSKFNSKIIIENRTELTDFRATSLVYSVLGQGKQSGENQYCWATTFTWMGRPYVVWARKSTGNTHSFVVENDT